MSWVTYKNGNYTVDFNTDNGTKIRKNNKSFFAPDFPESFDCNITNECDGGCPFCYQGCTTQGKHADLNAKFLDSLHPYTEMAINGNDLTHPDLFSFLKKMKEKNVIVSMTVNQKHFEKHLVTVKLLIEQELIHGLGVSLIDPTDDFIESIKQFPNAVIHVINGIVSLSQLEKLAYDNLKVLVLGYKELNRGKEYYSNPNEHEAIENLKNMLYDNLPDIIKNNWFNVISFDNLALKQLNVRRILSDKEWDNFYMGTDGEFTMYIDMVNQKYALNSLSQEKYPLENDIKTMFHNLQNKLK